MTKNCIIFDCISNIININLNKKSIMKKILKLSLVLFIMGLCVNNVVAQEKMTRKEKSEKRTAEYNNNFINIIKTQNFKFTVFGIDVDELPEYSGYQLDGGYFLYIENKELTVYLPTGGPNTSSGNNASIGEKINFTVKDYSIVLSPSDTGEPRIIIKARDPRMNIAYVFELEVENNKTYLTSYAPALDNIRYNGSLVKINKK